MPKRGVGWRAIATIWAPATYSNRPTTREVTLIEEEALDALRDVHHLQLAPGITRRNIVTRGAPLNHLIGKEFQVGAARLRGVRLCEPCQHLVDVSGMQALLPTLIHRGGLHAVIVASGTIEVGDTVMAVDERVE